ncbi:MAG: hypothetical protein V1846_03280 [Candidatus Komeilibacteria bacterium]
MPKFLECYPFSNPRVRLVEGFPVYDGVLGDPPGEIHRGIDYVLPVGKGLSFADGVQLAPGSHFNTQGLRALGFEVFGMHAGTAYQGTSSSWGRFVAVTSEPRRGQTTVYRTIYAHLATVNKAIPHLPADEADRWQFKEAKIDCGDYLGRAGNTGRTKRIIQLHIEVFEHKGKGASWQKIDPYGIYTKPASSGAYPQPGESLGHLRHHRWILNDPPFPISTRIGR